MQKLTALLTGRANPPALEGNEAGLPLVVAIHGGSYSSAYFDLPGRSLLAAGAANGIPVIAIDRPGYGETEALAPDAMDIAGQARFLIDALGELWADYGRDRAGIVLVGHSIGAAIAAAIASAPGNLPLLGLAISGVGLATNPGDHERWSALPDTLHVDLPPAIKDMVMFGPPGSYAADMPGASRPADAPAVRAELLAITGWWNHAGREILGRIAVPVHYRQAESDHLWIVSKEEIRAFAEALTEAPRVDARMVEGAGHCMDFHLVGPALHLQQLGFACEAALGAA